MKSGLTIASLVGSLLYLYTENRGKSLILPSYRPITPPFPTKTADESRKLAHGRPFPVQEHHAPQGPPGCPEVEIVRQAGAGNHGGCEAWHSGSGDEPALARCRHCRSPEEHAQGQYRARHQEGDWWR